MSRSKLIEETPFPRTRRLLALALREAGVRPGMILTTHLSMRSLGWVAGGPLAVIGALMDAVTPEGTLIMAAHSTGLTDPAGWQHPPVPEDWQQRIREEMPPFDPLCTPATDIGVVPELFRTMPGVMRSAHPHFSFAAWGAKAKDITSGHGLDFGMGPESPLAKAADLGGFVLLLGVSYDRNSSFHAGEYLVSRPQEIVQRAPVDFNEDGTSRWVDFREMALCESSEVFPAMGEAFEATHSVCVGQVGSATSRLFAQREAIDFAGRWIERHQVVS